MTPERWQRLKELFATASALEPSRQQAYLQDACGGDAELLSEVSSLLHINGEAIVDKPAAAYLNPATLGEVSGRWVGKRIGAYEIIALLGVGGMGEVYRARRVDAEYEKEVAIKLVPASYQAQYVLQRFRAERQILATLDHPGIARLIDGGATEDGLPFLIMELVDGEPIDRYCERKNLSQRERLALFRQVCSAVAYAHQHLVVHRDLKPNNILVTADGTVKLLDFGIAKLLQPVTADSIASPTVTQMRALTPGFSSPEQILGGAITTASDTYSLGVLLYLLLTGRSPYRGTLTSTQDAIREVVENEPTRSNLVRDLDAITLRALRKEPERRYATVDQFSEDIRRFLDGLPVVAQGDRLSYRAGKFLRRHKLTLAAASLAGLALIVAAVISLRQAHIAVAERARAEQERARAERHFASVRKLADVFMFEMHDTIKDLPGSTEARTLLIKTALEYLNTLSAEAGEDAGLQFDLANAYLRVADIQGKFAAANTGESGAALESYRHAIQLLEPLAVNDSSNGKVQLALGQSYYGLGRLQLLLGAGDDARLYSQKAVTVLEQLAGRDDSLATQREFANALVARGQVLGQLGNVPEGLASAEAGMKVIEKLARDNPDDLETIYRQGVTYTAISELTISGNSGLARLDRAIEFNNKSLAIDTRLVQATQGNNTQYLRSLFGDHVNLCYTQYDKQNFKQAVEHCRAAQPMIEKLTADKDNVQSRIDHGTFRWNLGKALLAAGEDSDAERTFTENVASLVEIEKQSDTLVVQYLLAASEQGLGAIEARSAQRAADRGTARKHWKTAMAWYERAVPRFEKVTSNVTLDASDSRAVIAATEGLARSRAEISGE